MTQKQEIDFTKLPAPNLEEISEEEEERLNDLAYGYLDSGEEEKAMDIFRMLPVQAWTARSMKELRGIEWILNNHVNLSRAIKELGNDWLYG